MSALPFIDSPAAGGIPIYALAASDWARFSESAQDGLRRLAQAMDFKAQQGRILLQQNGDGALSGVLFGLGDARNAALFGLLGRDLPSGDYSIANAPESLSRTEIAIAWALGAYVFDRYKARKKAAPRLAWPEGLDRGHVTRLVRAVWGARDLVNTPANDMGPEALHAAAEAIAHQRGAKFDAIVGEELLKQNYPLIHAVGRAATQSPRIVKMSWGDEKAPRVTLVGKGVTFDSGGLDIKPDTGMRLMKKDMGGAAVALSLGAAIMDAGLPVRLDVYCAIVENAISGDAFRPGDIVTSRKGLTVEVDNTDAEGRLILADALARASEDAPALMLDFATLTGAARIALGPDITPLMTDDDALSADFTKASAATGDMTWRLPLWNAYDSDMDSPIADLKNTGDAAMAGSIYGGLFLRRFVNAAAWAHLDIYAWTPKDKPARPAGADAQGLRAAYHVIADRFGTR